LVKKYPGVDMIKIKSFTLFYDGTFKMDVYKGIDNENIL